MATDRGRIGSAAAVAAAILALLLLLVAQAPATSGQTGTLGVGILEVDGSLTENITLPAGPYYLTIAPDAGSFVNASLTYNGSLMAQANRTLGESTQVSLIAGTYTLSLVGRGRAALGTDFTNGSLQEYPDNQTLVAFLVPSGQALHVTVSMGDALSISLRAYDDGLLEAGNATLTSSRTVDISLPPLRDSIAYLVAVVTSGNPNGRFGLSWTSEPPAPPIDLTAWPWFLVWILVPIAVASVILVLVNRRRFRRGGMP